MRRVLRVGLTAVSLWGLVGTIAPRPAEATTLGAMAFAGVYIIGPHGIAYPLIDNSQAPNLTNPTWHLTTGKMPPHISNSAVIEAFGTTACVGTVVSNKSAPPPGKWTAGTCTISSHIPGATGTVHGYCGLSDGTINLIMNFGFPNSYSVNVSFVTLAEKMVLSGHWHKHGTMHSGVLLGRAEFSPDTLGVMSLGTGTCLAKTRKAYLSVGQLVFGSATSATPTSLPHISLPRISTPLSTSVSFGL
jgi:hypothetical protein